MNQATGNDDPTLTTHPQDDWEHREAANKITASFANQAFVQPLGDGLIRVSFGESYPDELEPKYHAAVVLSARNALELAMIMQRISAAVLDPPPVVRTNTASEEQSG